MRKPRLKEATGPGLEPEVCFFPSFLRAPRNFWLHGTGKHQVFGDISRSWVGHMQWGRSRQGGEQGPIAYVLRWGRLLRMQGGWHVTGPSGWVHMTLSVMPAPQCPSLTPSWPGSGFCCLVSYTCLAVSSRGQVLALCLRPSTWHVPGSHFEVLMAGWELFSVQMPAPVEERSLGCGTQRRRKEQCHGGVGGVPGA